MASTDRARAPFLYWVAAILLVFNLIDGMLTLAAVHAGAATEANPLLAGVLDQGAVWFIAVKTTLVSLGVLLLWLRRERILAAGGLCGAAVIYAGIIAHHLSGLPTWAG
jgi:hypothetical protein